MFGFREKKLLTKIRDYKSTFENEAGRRVFHDLMRFCKFSDPFCPGKLDKDELVYAEGQRNVLLYIMRTLSMDAVEIEKHLKEAARENQQREIEIERFD